MKALEIKSCYGAVSHPNVFQMDVTPSTNTTKLSIFDGNGIDGYNAFISPENVLRIRDWFNERVRQLIFEGQLDNHLSE
jgi:hypothetical protein